MHQHARQSLRWERRIRSEAPSFIGTGTLALFLVYGNVCLADPAQLIERGVLFVWLLTAIACCIFGVVRHADALAELLGEPFGTLILTRHPYAGHSRFGGGTLIAALILAPESITASKAALANKLQRSINLCLGSALSTVALTVPLVLMIGLATGQSVTLGLEDENILLLALTLMVSILTFGRARTNVLHGAVHLLLFFTYLVLIFNP